MSIGGIVVPRSFRRTATQRLRDYVYERRALTDPADREIRLPISLGPGHRLEGCPPSGAFTLTPSQEANDDSAAGR